MTLISLVNTRTVIGVGVFILGVVTGGTAIHDYDNEADHVVVRTSRSTSSSSTTKASDFRTTLVTLAIEHMIYTDKVVDQVFNGSADEVSMKTLDDNSVSIGKMIGSVYGTSATTLITSLWKIHMDDILKYATAGNRGDFAGKSAALADLDSKYTKPLASYFAKVNPKLPEAVLEGVFRDHIAMTAKMIDYRSVGDYTNEQMELNAANEHIEELFSTLASAIVQQYPGKFNE